MVSREECESMGMEFVEGYHRPDGTYVRSFCRKVG